MNRYSAFGLCIESDIAFANLQSSVFSQADVSICLEPALHPAEAPAFRWEIQGDQCILHAPNVGRIRMENGTRISVAPCAGSSANALELYLMGSCMGAILFQRHILPLHGSCVKIGDVGVLLTGQSGAGKSTVTAALLGKGAQLITDDVAAVRLTDDGMPLVYPSYPSQKLWQDVLDRMNEQSVMQPLNRIMNDMDKYNVNRCGNFCDQPTALRAVYVLAQGETPAVTLEAVTGMDKITALATNTYRKFLAKQLGLEKWFFLQVAAIANRTKVYRITRPVGEHAEIRIADMVLEMLTAAKV